jgi:hypothetical protein
MLANWRSSISSTAGRSSAFLRRITSCHAIEHSSLPVSLTAIFIRDAVGTPAEHLDGCHLTLL